jgi:endo-1,4-beta-xylanase
MLAFVLLVIASPTPSFAEDAKPAAKPAPASKPKKRAPFHWVNPLPKGKYPGVRHAVFRSPSMKREVGYCIYLPPGYDEAASAEQRYPVVYYLHGGRPGNETRSVGLSVFIDKAIKAQQIPPTIYVFVNGGEVSHYNYPEKNSLGEDVFIKELIPHVDRTYRTIAERAGRGLEGFSQGGRGSCSSTPGFSARPLPVVPAMATRNGSPRATVARASF